LQKQQQKQQQEQQQELQEAVAHEVFGAHGFGRKDLHE